METKKAIRVAHIDASVADDEKEYRLRLELRRNDAGQLRWYDATNDEWIDSHDINSVTEAMETLYAWYNTPTWHLTVGQEK